MLYVTSQALDPVVVDYYLSLLPAVPASHARKRLVMLDCNDRSMRSLSQKIVERPRLLERIRSEVMDFDRAHIVCFNSSPWERTLAVRLGLPLHSVDPELAWLGSKSGCRETFREAGVLYPGGRHRAHRLAAYDLLGQRVRGDDADLVAGAFTSLVEEIARYTGPSIIVSEEELGLARPIGQAPGGHRLVARSCHQHLLVRRGGNGGHVILVPGEEADAHAHLCWFELITSGVANAA